MKTSLENYLEKTRDLKDRPFIYSQAEKLFPSALREIAELQSMQGKYHKNDSIYKEFQTWIDPIQAAIDEVKTNLKKSNEK